MAIPRRPLLTATAAGTLLCALWFVPSAHADGDRSGAPGPEIPTAASAQAGPGATALAENGPGFDTTPYLLGGMAFLGAGAGFAVRSARRTEPRPVR
ncbi:hypothetical protein [Streptomyces sp. NPDC057682]|uniref:hypothetical protein n=1 Tax=unclassified Streptomyces TaxID=2593676 RepID=UPI00364D63CC